MASTVEGFRYKDKVTIVTGGAQGIGRACVEVFANHGSKVVIADIKDDVGKELENSINERGVPGQSLYIRCDVTDENEIELALKHLRVTKGNIINMASMTGVHAQSVTMPYGVSKFGIIGFTKTLAIDESKNGVRVNCVSPAATNTPLLNRALYELNPNGAKLKEFFEKHSQFMGRLCEPEEVAKACLYLATDATYSTGQNLYVSGG